MLEIDNLYVETEKKLLLENICLRIEDGELYTVTGKSGSGKSILLKTICGLYCPSKGNILLDGMNYCGQRRQIIKMIGYLPQRIGVYESLTVFEYMDFFASAWGIKKKEKNRMISDLLCFAHLDGMEERFLEKVSEELKRKLCFAAVLLRSPKLLLLDEPCAGLEPDGREEIKRMIKALKDRGTKILTISKNLTDFSDLCGRTAILENGKLRENVRMEDFLTGRGNLRPLIIQMVSGIEQAINILKEHSMIENIAINGSTISATFHGSVEEEGKLLSSLVRGGAEISAYYRGGKEFEQ